jgi:hypothetical protein
VRDFVYDRGRGLRFYKQCVSAVASDARGKHPGGKAAGL